MKSGRVYRGIDAGQRRAERRRQVLEAGFDAFATEGYHSTSITRLCAAAGLNSRYFYEEFTDREDLLLAVIDEINKDSLGVMRAAMASAPDDVEGRIYAVLSAVLRWYITDPRRAQIMWVRARGISRRVDEHLRVNMDQFVTAAAEEFRQYADRGLIPARPDFTAVAIMLLAASTELSLAWAAGRLSLTIDEVIDEAAYVYLAVLTGPRSHAL